MLCALSGEAPVEPVVSIKSGLVFEKKLIEKHIKLTSSCPVTKEVLTEVDLLPLKTNVVTKPRPPSATSIPGLIHMFQNEWDSLMLETYNLKQNLETVRQELAHSLYQHDAACRVIARLVKERDEARSTLANAQANITSAASVVGADGPAGGEDQAMEAGITAEMVKTMQMVAKRLSKGRKKRTKTLAGKVARKENIKRYTALSSHPLHSASKPGVLCVDVHPVNQDMVVTGGADGTAIVFNRTTGKMEDTLRGHKKKVTQVLFHPSERLIFTSSADATATIWQLNPENGKYAASVVLKNHKEDVVGCTIHPSGSFLVTASTDRTWCFYDIPNGICRQQVSGDFEAGYTRVTFHPDGLILGAGTEDSIVRIFDVKLQKNLANFKGHTGRITGMSFSENGYYLASADDKGTVKLWDLRKLQNFHTISVHAEGSSKTPSSIHHLDFDSSGTYLGVASDSDVRVYNSKGWEIVKTWNDHSKPVTSMKFGDEANWFVTTSLDRTMKFFGDASMTPADRDQDRAERERESQRQPRSRSRSRSRSPE